MKAIELDARRYAWCHGNARWLMGLECAQWMEDLQGAAAANQRGLVRYVSRAIGEECAVMLALIVHHAKPIPSPQMRAAWALERIAGHDLHDPCWELIRGVDVDAEPPWKTVARCEALLDAVREIVGDAPNPLTPEGYHPALALARDWLKLADAVEEEGPLPSEWTKGG